MNTKELYELALTNVHKYSLLNEIFSIRDTRGEISNYTIGVNGFISYDVINRYVRYIDELSRYEDIGSIKDLKQLQQENTNLKKSLNEIEEYITSYESISTIQGLDNIEKNKILDEKTMIEMTDRYLKVHDNILQIIDKVLGDCDETL